MSLRITWNPGSRQFQNYLCACLYFSDIKAPYSQSKASEIPLCSHHPRQPPRLVQHLSPRPPTSNRSPLNLHPVPLLLVLLHKCISEADLECRSREGRDGGLEKLESSFVSQERGKLDPLSLNMFSHHSNHKATIASE